MGVSNRAFAGVYPEGLTSHTSICGFREYGDTLELKKNHDPRLSPAFPPKILPQLTLIREMKAGSPHLCRQILTIF